MQIVMIGAGYVGLVSSACLAGAGHNVLCLDNDKRKIDGLKCGVLPLYEPGLEEIVSLNVRAGRLSFSSDHSASIREANAVFIAVGTPARRGDGHADLSQVFAATAAIAPQLAPATLVVLKSTVPVGTCDEVESIIAQHRPDLDFQVASNPEFLRAGSAIADFLAPDRVVIGADEDAVRHKMAGIYGPVFAQPTPILYTTRRTAELIKYAANAFLATKIAFINEVANLCERVGADVEDIARGIGLDARIGPHFLRAGPGFGGSCFPKDALALIKMGEDNETPMRIVETVLGANETRKRAMARKIAAAVGGSLRGKTIALLGLTFKPDTDDMREAPSVALIAGLSDLHATIRAYDPVGMDQAKAAFPSGVVCCQSEYEAAEGAHAIVLVTEWAQFRALDLNRLRRVMRTPVMIDLRNAFSLEDLVGSDFRYYRIGAPQLVPAMPLTLPSGAAAQGRRVSQGMQRANGSALRPRSRRRLATEYEVNSAG